MELWTIRRYRDDHSETPRTVSKTRDLQRRMCTHSSRRAILFLPLLFAGGVFTTIDDERTKHRFAYYRVYKLRWPLRETRGDDHHGRVVVQRDGYERGALESGVRVWLPTSGTATRQLHRNGFNNKNVYMIYCGDGIPVAVYAYRCRLPVPVLASVSVMGGGGRKQVKR